MKILMRAVLGLGATLLAVGLSIGALNAANADGPGTDPAVVKAIKQQPWVEIGPDDYDYRTGAMRCYLVQFGYYDNCAANGAWPADFTAAVQKYQKAHNLPQTGKLDIETWGALQAQGGEVGQGSTKKAQVMGIQYTMKVLQDSSLEVDGQYGAGTAKAVKAFQERKEIDADGIFGPITFRAAFAKGGENKRTPGR